MELLLAIFAFSAFVAFFFILDKNSLIRKFLLIFLAVILAISTILMALYFADYLDSKEDMIKRQQQEAQYREARKQREDFLLANKIKEEEIALKKLKLTPIIVHREKGFIPPFFIDEDNKLQATARLENYSLINLDNFVLQYFLEDCSSSHCIVVGSGTKTLELNIPSQQARDFDISIGSSENRIFFKEGLQLKINIFKINISPEAVSKNNEKECQNKAFCTISR